MLGTEVMGSGKWMNEWGMDVSKGARIHHSYQFHKLFDKHLYHKLSKYWVIMDILTILS